MEEARDAILFIVGIMQVLFVVCVYICRLCVCVCVCVCVLNVVVLCAVKCLTRIFKRQHLGILHEQDKTIPFALCTQEYHF